MSQFDQWFSDVAAPELLEQLGQTVQLAPAGEASADVTAIVHELGSREEDHTDGRVLVWRLQVKLASTVAGVARGAVLTYGGKNWGFDEDHGTRGSLRTTMWTRTDPIDKTRRGRQMRR